MDRIAQLVDIRDGNVLVSGDLFLLRLCDATHFGVPPFGEKPA